MKLLVGTSGWQFPAIKEKFKASRSGYTDLQYYATLFNTVENNSAFYHMPRITTLQKWYDNSPDDFIFSIKLNRTFTHDHRLQLNDERIATLELLLNNLQTLQDKLGAVLIQTPPGLHYDLDLLKNFLNTTTNITGQLKFKPDIAIEFPHESWFTKDVYKQLRKQNIALVTSESSKYPLQKIITADFTYIRFHGPEKLFRSTYSDEQMTEWKEYIKTLPKDLKKIYIYFNNTLSPYVLQNGLQMLA
jgi:uncharacterized protein YecE (DUF72 family)